MVCIPVYYNTLYPMGLLLVAIHTSIEQKTKINQKYRCLIHFGMLSYESSGNWKIWMHNQWHPTRTGTRHGRSQQHWMNNKVQYVLINIIQMNDRFRTKGIYSRIYENIGNSTSPCGMTMEQILEYRKNQWVVHICCEKSSQDEIFLWISSHWYVKVYVYLY